MKVKYRAWHKEEKKMLEVFGIDFTGLIAGGDEPAVFFRKEEFDWVRDFEKPYIAIALKNVELMQFTGLKDKNGKEIYHSDLLKCEEWIFEVIWDMGDGCWNYWIVSKNWSNKMFCDPDRSEVIGNIYENPDLL